MCARYTLTVEQARLVLAGLVHIFAFAPRYNIGPAQRAPVIVHGPKGARQEEMQWGFKSDWSKSLHINAQSERLKETRAFKYILGQRCLVPMDGFYEWKPDKSPLRFVRPKRDVFYVAGLWKGEAEAPQAGSFVVLTAPAGASVKPIHPRMPLIVRESQHEQWLEGDLWEGVLNVPDDSPLEYYPVSREVNNARKEGPDLIQPVPEERELF